MIYIKIPNAVPTRTAVARARQQILPTYRHLVAPTAGGRFIKLSDYLAAQNDTHELIRAIKTALE